MLSTRCCKNKHSLHGLSTEVTVLSVSYVHHRNRTIDFIGLSISRIGTIDIIGSCSFSNLYNITLQPVVLDFMIH